MASVQEGPTGLNLRGGLLRLWVFVTVIWAGWVLITWPNQDSDLFGPYVEDGSSFTRSLDPGWKLENERLYVPVSFEMGFLIPWRGTEILWVKPEQQANCEPSQPNDRNICARFVREFEKRDGYRRVEYFKHAPLLAFIPPALIAALLIGLGWVIGGFSGGSPRAPRSPS